MLIIFSMNSQENISKLLVNTTKWFKCLSEQLHLLSSSQAALHVSLVGNDISKCDQGKHTMFVREEVECHHTKKRLE